MQFIPSRLPELSSEGVHVQGLHSSTFQLNLNRSSHCQTEANQHIPLKVLTLS